MEFTRRFNKSKHGEEFINDCRRDAGFIEETEKTITMRLIPAEPSVFYAMVQSGQIAESSIWKDYYPNNPTRK